ANSIGRKSIPITTYDLGVIDHPFDLAEEDRVFALRQLYTDEVAGGIDQHAIIRSIHRIGGMRCSIDQARDWWGRIGRVGREAVTVCFCAVHRIARDPATR